MKSLSSQLPTLMVNLFRIADDFSNSGFKVVAQDGPANTVGVAKGTIALFAKTIGDTDILQDAKNRLRT